MYPLYEERLWFKSSWRHGKKCPLYGVSALECPLWRAFVMRDSLGIFPGPSFFFLLREVSTLDDVCFKEVPMQWQKFPLNLFENETLVLHQQYFQFNCIFSPSILLQNNVDNSNFFLCGVYNNILGTKWQFIPAYKFWKCKGKG